MNVERLLCLVVIAMTAGAVPPGSSVSKWIAVACGALAAYWLVRSFIG